MSLCLYVVVLNFPLIVTVLGVKKSDDFLLINEFFSYVSLCNNHISVFYAKVLRCCPLSTLFQVLQENVLV